MRTKTVNFLEIMTLKSLHLSYNHYKFILSASWSIFKHGSVLSEFNINELVRLMNRGIIIREPLTRKLLVLKIKSDRLCCTRLQKGRGFVHLITYFLCTEVTIYEISVSTYMHTKKELPVVYQTLHYPFPYFSLKIYFYLLCKK